MKYFITPHLYFLHRSSGNGIIIDTNNLKKVLEAIRFWNKSFFGPITKIECFDGTRWINVTGEFTLFLPNDITLKEDQEND